MIVLTLNVNYMMNSSDEDEVELIWETIRLRLEHNVVNANAKSSNRCLIKLLCFWCNILTKRGCAQNHILTKQRASRLVKILFCQFLGNNKLTRCWG